MARLTSWSLRGGNNRVLPSKDSVDAGDKMLGNNLQDQDPTEGLPVLPGLWLHP